jgi:hypothetical protein
MAQPMRSVTVAPSHTLVLYSRPLHPELFTLKGRKAVTVGRCDGEGWLLPGGHMVRFQSKQHCFCELVIDRDNGLPMQGVLASFPASGDREFEQVYEDAAVSYTCAVQSENLSDTLYASTLAEMRQLARETSSLLHEWTVGELATGRHMAMNGAGGRCLSMLSMQRFEDELHVEGTHMHPAGGLVVRSQTVFQPV